MVRSAAGPRNAFKGVRRQVLTQRLFDELSFPKLSVKRKLQLDCIKGIDGSSGFAVRAGCSRRWQDRRNNGLRVKLLEGSAGEMLQASVDGLRVLPVSVAAAEMLGRERQGTLTANGLNLESKAGNVPSSTQRPSNTGDKLQSATQDDGPRSGPTYKTTALCQGE